MYRVWNGQYAGHNRRVYPSRPFLDRGSPDIESYRHTLEIMEFEGVYGPSKRAPIVRQIDRDMPDHL